VVLLELVYLVLLFGVFLLDARGARTRGVRGAAASLLLEKKVWRTLTFDYFLGGVL